MNIIKLFRVKIEHRGIKIFIIIIWNLSQIGIFMYTYFNLYNNSNYSEILSVVNHSLIISKSSAAVINLNFMLLFFTVNKVLIYKLIYISENFPVNQNVTFHKFLGISIGFFSIIHVLAHIYNFYKLNLTLLKVSSVTGILLCICFVIIYTSSLRFIRIKSFHTFYYVHQIYILIVVLLLLHGSFCLIKTNSGECSGPGYYKWIIVPFLLYCFEIIQRYRCSKKETYFMNIKKYSNDINSIELYKPNISFKAGQWILLNCPDIGYEWHPFTITSNPIEYGKVEINLKETGDWTKLLVKYLLKYNNGQVKDIIRISYPYGNNYNIITNYKVTLLIASGIGITAFMSLLKRLPCSLGHGNEQVYLKKIYLYWVCKKIQDFNAFLPRLHIIQTTLTHNGESPLEIHLFITEENYINHPPFIFNFERPNFDTIFYNISKLYSNIDIKVLFCGNDKLNTIVYNKCYFSSKYTNCKFWYQKGESFN